jgi:hypothetical protein
MHQKKLEEFCCLPNIPFEIIEKKVQGWEGITKGF